MNTKFLWDNVKQLIKARNTTQEGLAKTCNISFNTLQSWISKNRLPDVVSAYKIAQALNTTVEFLLTGNSTNPAEVELKELKQNILELLSLHK